ncbi:MULTISPECIES: DUF1707 domain-containing protein [Thermomonosporaceae]|uniref:DUF1707 domain-containing protein n=1 Tax=Thermomonosporaceae TaxID=2012 RepID=UPI00255B2C6C|nr:MULTISPECIES: DUF1707 domain-containing protein [Thermomonosporaceae]MDL4774618.1 DUF1707 domain-containing protein [Actinomadura xylanilytica]
MTNLPDRADSPNPPEMRASDTDRDRVAQILRDAAGDGRLTLEELDERLDLVYAAKTYADLEPVTRDLPAAGSPGPSVPVTGRAPGFAPVPDAPSWKSGVAVMAEFKRQGVWNVPAVFTAFAFWGGGKIDLREARFSENEVRIRAFAVMGGIDVIAPEDLTVHVTGIGIMGGFEHDASGPGAAGAPRVIVSGFSFWGGVSVKRKARREEKRLRREQRRREELE